MPLSQRPADEAVRASLEKMVSSEAFGKAARPVRFLRYLVETTLRGESALLKESVLGVEVFERPPDWSPRADPIVRQEAARLRKRIAKYYASAGSGDEIRIELPVGSYVPVFRGVVEANVPYLTAGARWGFIGVGVVVVLMVMGVLVWRTFSRPAGVPSIAVLPFTDLSADPANQYFADGLTDEITDILSRMESLRVVSRSSSFRYRGQQADVKEAGGTLKVAHVLKGSVERSGDRIRITVHLDRVSDGTSIWSHTYERGSSELSKLPAELAANVAATLKANPRRASGGHVPSEEAHRAVMKAAYETEQMTPDSLVRAEQLAQQAIDLDPAYANAYSMLGAARYNLLLYIPGSDQSREKGRKDTEAPLRRALELDPELSFPRATLGTLALQYDWDWKGAEEAYRRAVLTTVDVDVVAQYAFLLCARGRFAECDEQLRRAQDLDPVGPLTLNMTAIIRNLEGRFAETREAAELIIQLAPESKAVRFWDAQTYVEEGHPELALPVVRALRQQFPSADIYEAAAEAGLGHREAAMSMVRSLEGKFPDSISATDLAFVYGCLGDEGKAVKWLQKAADMRDMRVLGIGVHPAYASMRGSAGFQALLRRIGLS